jgi:ornithine cyclodeaminase
MLYLSEKDILEAAAPSEVVDEVEAAMVLYEKKDFFMPDRMHVDYCGNTLLLMPCFARHCLGTKLVTLFPENTEKNVPVLYGLMILNSGETGEPLAVLNGSALTALRTGAVGSVGIRYLTPDTVNTLGVVGAGVQGFSQALTACSQRKFSAVYVLDTVPERMASFCRKLSAALPEINVIQVKSAEHLLRESQVVITTTTSLKPVLPDKEKLLEGKYFIGIGSYKPEMREFPKSLFKLLKRMYIDTDIAREESGDLITPVEKNWIKKEQVFSIGKLITGQIKDKPGKNGTSLFKSVGMALFDIVVSEFIFRRAKQLGLGTEVEI